MEKIKRLKKKFKQFNLLLDVAFARSTTFSRLRKRANVKHAYFDYGASRQMEDEEIFRRANKDGRFVVTINFKHFRKFVRPNKPGIIAIPGDLPNEDIDELLSAFVSANNPEDYFGKEIKLSTNLLADIKKKKKK